MSSETLLDKYAIPDEEKERLHPADNEEKPLEQRVETPEEHKIRKAHELAMKRTITDAEHKKRLVLQSRN